MTTLNNIQKLVEEILETNKKARGSDDLLYWLVAKECLKRNKVKISDLTAKDLFMKRAALGAPKTESVRRARQKIQVNRPDLRPDKETLAERAKEEKKYRKYALDN